jgi:glycosyltransferase involved in cell wall biosynthesis
MGVSFTVIVPTHNRRERLLTALESVRMQTRAPDEIFVVADGCTDGSPDAVRELGDERIEVLDLPKGPRLGWEHRNEALAKASGDVIAWLGDDDLWFPDHLERAGALFDTGAFDLVQATVCLVYPSGDMLSWGLDWRVPRLRERFVKEIEHRTPMSAVSHRRGLAEEAGGWTNDPAYRWGDADLWRRILATEPRTTMMTTPTVVFMPAHNGPRQNPVEEGRGFLVRLRDPVERELLRSEVALIAHTEVSNLEATVESQTARADLAEEREAATSSRLERVIGGGWWRLRERLLPLLRPASALRRRLGR